MSKWTIDPDHSVGAFPMRHMTIAFVPEQFNKVYGISQWRMAASWSAKRLLLR
jgi:hypothetical protein